MPLTNTGILPRLHWVLYGITALLVGCGEPDNGAGEAAQRKDAVVSFKDAALDTGLAFTHRNGMSGELYFVEMTGAGAALFDYDGDGDLDLYLLQGQALHVQSAESTELADPGELASPHSLDSVAGDRLFRNDLYRDEQGRTHLHFSDVTADAGIDMPGYGMGVASGDYDNDGNTDLYVTRFGANRLLHNLGNGRFEDATNGAGRGIDDPRWSTSAAFVDIDRDGWLDLYVCNYVNFTLATNKRCSSVAGQHDYCGPSAYSPQADRLLRNRGDGSFEDVTATSGIASEIGACLGVVVADFDGDGDSDLYVANDGMANYLWVNDGSGHFENTALFGGAAYNRDGVPEASMGVDAADFDNDGDPDLILAHLRGETNTLYRNDGGGRFVDVGDGLGLGAASRSYTAFGTAWLDYDKDGWLDLFMANGEVNNIEAQLRAGEVLPLRQRNQLFHNLGNGRFADVSTTAGPALARSEVSRAVALGDIDNDGAPDLVVTNNNGPVRLLLNQAPAPADGGNHWLGLRLVDPRLRRDVHAARVELLRPGLPPLWRRVRVAGSYLAANDPRVLIGLGAMPAIEAVRVYWPDGLREQWSVLAADRYTTLSRGQGEAF